MALEIWKLYILNISHARGIRRLKLSWLLNIHMQMQLRFNPREFTTIKHKTHPQARPRIARISMSVARMSIPRCFVKLMSLCIRVWESRATALIT